MIAAANTATAYGKGRERTSPGFCSSPWLCVLPEKINVSFLIILVCFNVASNEVSTNLVSTT